MQLVDIVRKADETNELTVESRFIFILSKVMEASLKGSDSLRVDGFASFDIPEGDIMAKKIAKRLIEFGFKVIIKSRNSYVYGNHIRGYYFEISWKNV